MDMREEPAVLMVASDPRELTGVLAHCSDVRKVALPVRFARSAILNGASIVLVAHGPGFHLAAEAASVPVNAAALVSTGSCGALDPALTPGDVLVAATVNGIPCDRPCTTRKYRTGTLLSVDRVVGTIGEKRALNGSAVEMEAAAVAEAARERGARFYCVRAVLDSASEGFTLDFNRLRGRDGRFSPARIVAAALARPRAGIRELIYLERRTRLCSQALGDFLGDCRF
jgi:adenosylhomocysteine nucleosidase